MYASIPYLGKAPLTCRSNFDFKAFSHFLVVPVPPQLFSSSHKVAYLSRIAVNKLCKGSPNSKAWMANNINMGSAGGDIPGGNCIPPLISPSSSQSILGPHFMNLPIKRERSAQSSTKGVRASHMLRKLISF